MYENIGSKIKKLAEWTYRIEALGAILGGTLTWIRNGFADGSWCLLIILLGPVVAYVSSWLLYAFGELVEDIHAIRSKFAPCSEAQAKAYAEEKKMRDRAENEKRKAEKKKEREALSPACEFCGRRDVTLKEYRSKSTLGIDQYVVRACAQCARENDLV